MVTACDFESGRFGSNPEWGLIYYKASITAQGLPEPSSLRGSTSVPEQLNINTVTGSCKLIYGCRLELCSATVSVVSAGICYRNEVNSIAWLYRRAQPKIVSSTTTSLAGLLDTICSCCMRMYGARAAAMCSLLIAPNCEGSHSMLLYLWIVNIYIGMLNLYHVTYLYKWENWWGRREREGEKERESSLAEHGMFNYKRRIALEERCQNNYVTLWETVFSLCRLCL